MNKGYLYTLITNFFFAVTYLGTKYMFNEFPEIGVYNMAFWGLFAASCLVTPVFIGVEKNRQDLGKTLKKDGRIIFVIAMVSSCAAFLWLTALSLANTGPVALLIKTTVIYSIFLGLLFLKERLGSVQFLGVAIAVVGLVLISTLKGEMPLTAAILTLTAALGFSIQSFLVKKLVADVDGKSFAYLRALFMSLLFGAAFVVMGKLSFITLWQFVLLSFIHSSGLIIGRAFFFQAHNYLEISKISTMFLLEPVLIMIGAFFIFDEKLGPQKLAGSILILGGLWLIVQRDALKKTKDLS